MPTNIEPAHIAVIVNDLEYTIGALLNKSITPAWAEPRLERLIDDLRALGGAPAPTQVRTGVSSFGDGGEAAVVQRKIRKMQASKPLDGVV